MKKTLVFKKSRLKNFIAACSQELAPKHVQKTTVYTLWNETSLKLKLMWERGNKTAFEVAVEGSPKKEVELVWKKMRHYIDSELTE